MTEPKEYFSRTTFLPIAIVAMLYALYLKPYLDASSDENSSDKSKFCQGVISAEGIGFISSDQLTSKIPWSKIYRAKRTQELIILFAEYVSPMAFPRNFFKNESDWQQFGNWVDHYAPATENQTGHDSMSNRIFHLHCPSCGKNISDADALCPYCGVNLDAPLDKEELQALAQPLLEDAQKAFETGRNLQDALDKCDQAIEYIPESAEAHNLRGLMLDALGKTAEAILAYQEALSLDPDLADAKENLVEAQTEYKNNRRRDVRPTAAISQKFELTKGKAILLGLLSAWVFFYVIVGNAIYFIVFPLDNPTFAGNLQPDQVPIFFGVGVPIMLVTLLIFFALLGYYTYHINKFTTLSANQKGLWSAALYISCGLAMPVYWYLYIWKPLKSDAFA